MQSPIGKVLQKAVSAIINRIWLLLFFLPFCYALWIGELTTITCQNPDFVRIDCTLQYQSLWRASEQKIKGVQAMKIDVRDCSTDGSTTEYSAVLQTQNFDYPIKTYSNYNDPELETLNDRFKKFISNPKEKLMFSFHYSRWGSILNLLLMGAFMFLFFFLVVQR